MADSYNVKKITELAAKSASDDTDLYVVGNQGTATMRKISFATIAAAVRDKLTSLTFPSLNTSNKTLPGAVNELNSKSVTDLGTLIPVNANLNDYTTPGRYYASSTANITNMPVAGSSSTTLDLIVMARASSIRVHQIAYIYTTATTRAYIRVMTGASQWSGWQEMTNGELETKVITNLGTSITGSANLNNYTTPGRYYAVSTDSISNLPVTGAVTIPMDLIVMPRAATNRVYQIAFIYTSSNPFVYIRVQSGASTWSAWKAMT